METRMVVGGNAGTHHEPDPGLIDLVAKAHRYMQQLTNGADCSASELAERENLDVSDLSRILRLAFLAPDITEAIVDGRHPIELTPKKLMRIGEIPFDWDDQRAVLGFLPLNFLQS